VEWELQMELTEGEPDGTYSVELNMIVNDDSQQYMCVLTELEFSSSSSSSTSSSSSSSSSTLPPPLAANSHVILRSAAWRASRADTPFPYNNCGAIVNVTAMQAWPVPGSLGLPVVLDIQGEMTEDFTLKGGGIMHTLVIYDNQPVGSNQQPACEVFECPIDGKQPFSQQIQIILPPNFSTGEYEFNLWVDDDSHDNSAYFCVVFDLDYEN
jgi:hypothetical protein